MDQLFAPWRIDWVTREQPTKADACAFCSIPERDDHREALFVATAEESYVLLNNYPYSPGHALIVTHRHVESFLDLDPAELLSTNQLVQRTIAAMEQSMNPDGFNVGMNIGRGAGGSIDHLHVHVVPRWSGDTNFMAVVGDTKVIVQALDETYTLLHGAFADHVGMDITPDDGAVPLDV